MMVRFSDFMKRVSLIGHRQTLSHLTGPFTLCHTCCPACRMGQHFLRVRLHTHTHTQKYLQIKCLNAWQLGKKKKKILKRPSHPRMLRVHPILIIVLRDNDIVNEVRRTIDQRLMQPIVISGWSCQWCSNKVNNTWDPLLRLGWVSQCARTLSLEFVSLCLPV